MGFKRFLLFGIDQYYPSGGFGDFVADFDDKDEACEAGTKLVNDSWKVVDLVERVEIGKHGRYPIN